MTSKDPRPANLEATILREMLQCAAENGWAGATLHDAAQRSGLAAKDVHKRFPNKNRVLIYLGQQADERALSAQVGGTTREQLFDMFMRRLDMFQEHREGVRAVMKAVPFDPILGLMLSKLTEASMEWIGGAAEMDLSGFGGNFRVKALLATWGYMMRTWYSDHTEDLADTMSALDKALDRAERLGLLRSQKSTLFDASGSPPDENLSHKAK